MILAWTSRGIRWFPNFENFIPKWINPRFWWPWKGVEIKGRHHHFSTNRYYMIKSKPGKDCQVKKQNPWGLKGFKPIFFKGCFKWWNGKPRKSMVGGLFGGSLKFLRYTQVADRYSNGVMGIWGPLSMAENIWGTGVIALISGVISPYLGNL